MRQLEIACVALLALLSSVAAQDSQCDRLDLQVTTVPVMPQFANTLHRHFDLMRSIPVGPIDLMLIGDSLVQNWGADTWGQRAAGKKIFNFGVGADRTQNVLWRLQGDELRQVAPRNVLLLIGTNNLGADDKSCATMAGIEAIVQRVRQIWPAARVLFIAIPPRGNGWMFKNAQRLAVNAQLHSRAPAQNWAVIDDDAELTCQFMQPCGNYEPDLLHLSALGYRSLAATVIRQIGW